MKKPKGNAPTETGQRKTDGEKIDPKKPAGGLGKRDPFPAEILR